MILISITLTGFMVFFKAVVCDDRGGMYGLLFYYFRLGDWLGLWNYLGHIHFWDLCAHIVALIYSV